MSKIQYILALAALAAGAGGQCATIPFAGSGASGTIAPGALAWTLTANDESLGTKGLDCMSGSVSRCDISVWGVPALNGAALTWPTGTAPAIAFTITFTNLPSGVTIDQTADPDPGSLDDYTRFHDTGDSVVWTPSYSGGSTVTFTAPMGDSLSPGMDFYVNIAFTGGNDIDTAAFTGDWTTLGGVTSGVPEPGSLSLAGMVLLSGVWFGRRRILK